MKWSYIFLQLYQKDKEIRAKLESNREKEMERERQLAQGVKAREPKVPFIYYAITFRGEGGFRKTVIFGSLLKVV